MSSVSSYTCNACGRAIPTIFLHKPRHLLVTDHIVPQFAFGPDTDENKQTLCAECNRLKTSVEISILRTRFVTYCRQFSLPLREVCHICLGRKLPDAPCAVCPPHAWRGYISRWNFPIAQVSKGNLKFTRFAHFEELVRRQEGKCRTCGKALYACLSTEDRPLPLADMDHILPAKAGGSNDLSNFQLLCIECHWSKTLCENVLLNDARRLGVKVRELTDATDACLACRIGGQSVCVHENGLAHWQVRITDKEASPFPPLVSESDGSGTPRSEASGTDSTVCSF